MNFFRKIESAAQAKSASKKPERKKEEEKGKGKAYPEKTVAVKTYKAPFQALKITEPSQSLPQEASSSRGQVPKKISDDPSGLRMIVGPRGPELQVPGGLLSISADMSQKDMFFDLGGGDGLSATDLVGSAARHASSVIKRKAHEVEEKISSGKRKKGEEAVREAGHRKDAAENPKITETGLVSKTPAVKKAKEASVESEAVKRKAALQKAKDAAVERKRQEAAETAAKKIEEEKRRREEEETAKAAAEEMRKREEEKKEEARRREIADQKKKEEDAAKRAVAEKKKKEEDARKAEEEKKREEREKAKETGRVSEDAAGVPKEGRVDAVREQRKRVAEAVEAQRIANAKALEVFFGESPLAGEVPEEGEIIREGEAAVEEDQRRARLPAKDHLAEIDRRLIQRSSMIQSVTPRPPALPSSSGQALTPTERSSGGVLMVGGRRMGDGSISVTQFPVKFTELVKPFIEDMQVMRAHDRMLEARHQETVRSCERIVREKEASCQKLILVLSQDHETKVSELLEKHKDELAGLRRENELAIEELLKTAAVRENDLRIETAYSQGQNEVLKLQIADQAAEIERLKAALEKSASSAPVETAGPPAGVPSVPLAKVVDETNRIHRAAYEANHSIQFVQALVNEIQEIAARLAKTPEQKSAENLEDRSGL